jgi:hypothetical protein
MIKRAKWLLVIALMASCNNDNTPKTDAGKASTAHAGHMAATGINYCDSVNNGLIAEDTMKGSPHRTAMNAVSGNHVHIEYNSPGVKGRTIWGGLVPYGKVWATGAHQATSVQFSKDVEVNGKKIPAGKYAFFTIPGQEKWIVILNKRYDQHLADDYSEGEDVLRMEVLPEKHAMTQRLTYTVDKGTGNSGAIGMHWELLGIRVPFKVL